MTYRVANAKDQSTWMRDGVQVLVQTEDEPVPDGYQTIASGLTKPMADMVASLYIEIMEEEAKRIGAMLLPDDERPTLQRLAARHAIRRLSRKRRNADLREHGYAPSDRYRTLLSLAMIGRETILPFVHARKRVNP